MAFLGSGSAKLILFGEHAVVHGHPALGMGLPGRLTVKWTPGTSQLLLMCPAEYQPSIRLAFQRIAGYFGLDGSTGRLTRQALPGGCLEFESDIPVSAGLGSSGAVCVAMARAVAAYVDSAAHKHEAIGNHQTGSANEVIWAAAHDGEQVFHGMPSGVDTGLALWQRLSLFTPQPEGLPSVRFLPSTGIHLVFGTVPREASCAANVAAIGRAMAAGDVGVSAALAELGQLSGKAGALLDQSAALPDQGFSVSSGLGILANTAMDLLSNLELSTPAMDTILAAGLAAGATGGKLSGGGAGGAFWLASPSKDAVGRIQTAVIEEAHKLGLPGDAFTGVITI